MACQNAPSLDICPTQEEITPQLLALLPRGRAWNTHEGLPQPNTTIYQYFNTLAGVWAYANQRICALRLEFFCASANETLDLWNQQYGLPDGCDPFPDLCVKVAATGGVTCAYYEAIALEIGWSIACVLVSCTLDSGLMETGMDVGNVPGPATMLIAVDLEASPAYVDQQIFGPVTGFLETGMAISCGPDLTSLDCVLQRIVHAEVEIAYATF